MATAMPTPQTSIGPVDLSTTALLTSLTISSWSAVRNDSKINAEVAARYGSDSRMSQYKRYLIDPSALKPITQAGGALRTRHYTLTLPWGDDGARIISAKGYTRHAEDIALLQGELDGAVGQFCSDYPEHVRRAEYLLNGLYNAAEYPTPNEIKGKFGSKIRYRPVPSSDDIRIGKLSSEQLAVIRAQVQADTEQLQASAMADVVARIKDAVGHFAERMAAYTGARDGAFRDSVVENVRELVELLPELNLVNDPHIEAIRTQMEQELTAYTPNELRDSSGARERVAREAEKIVERMAAYGM